MARSTLSALVLLIALGSSGVARAQSADPDDPMSPHAQLRTLSHEAQEVSSGLAAIRRELGLLQLREMDDVGAAQLELTLEDHFFGMTAVSAMFSIDGAVLYQSSDPAQIETGHVFTGAITSGPHVLSVELVYRGDILYTTGLRARIRSSRVFDTSLGRTTHVRVVGHDTGVLAAPPTRWTVDYAIETDPAD